MSLISTARKAALSGVSILAIGMGTASAQSQFDGVIGKESGPLALSNYAASAINNQWLQGGSSVTADVLGNLLQITGPHTSGDVDASDNSFEVTAIGNTALNEADDTTSGTSGLGNGILTSQAVGEHTAGSAPESVVVTAAAGTGSDDFIGVRNEGLQGDTVTVSGNGVVAEVHLNDAVDSLAGVSSQDTGLAQGTADTTITFPDLTTPASSTAGSINSAVESAFNSLHNVQQSIASGTIAGSGATVRTTIELSNDAADPSDTAATPTARDVTGVRSLDGNSQTARYRGNAASNVVSNTDSTQVRGSTIVSNVQVNVEDGSASASANNSASVYDASIFAELTNVDDMTGVLSVSGNTNAAEAFGSEAINTIVFINSTEVTGAGGGVETDVDDTTAHVELSADFGIANVQANRDTLLRSVVDNSDIFARIDGDGTDGSNVDGGLVSVSENAISASATGDNAVNIVQIDDATSFSTSAAVANHQTNTGTPIEADVWVSDASIETSGSVEGGAALSLSGNARSATATANASENAVVIQASTLSAAGAGRADVYVDAGSVYTEGAGLGVTNVQTVTALSDDHSVWADIKDNFETVNVGGDPAKGTLGTGGVVGSTISVQGNRTVASATANEATSTIDASGTEGTLSAFVANQQDSGAKVNAWAWRYWARIDAGGISDSTVSLTDNLVKAVATGNTASNRLSASGFTDLELGDSPISADFGDYSASSSEADAALALVSSQRRSADLTAIIETFGISIDAFRIDTGTLSVARNSLQAIANGNDADNELNTAATELTTQDELVAALVNSQSIEAGATVRAKVEGQLGAVPDIGVTLKVSGTGVATGAAISVEDNVVVAAADGNVADNVLLVTGTIHQRDTDMTRLADGRNFVLSNGQTTAGGTEAEVTDVQIGVLADSTAASSAGVRSTLSAAGNEVVARARNNVATNRLDFGRDSAEPDDSRSFAGLKTTALVENMQENSGTAEAIIDDVKIVVDLRGNGDTSDTDFAISDNRLIAAASGTTADNSLNIAAVELMNGANGMDDSFGVSNDQTNSGAIEAKIRNNVQIGYNNQGDSAVSGTTMSVNRNLIAAEAYGTNAGSAYNVAALSSDQVRGGVSSAQTNSGGVTVSVSGLDIGITTSGSVVASSGGLSSVRGNSITATAVGNRAVNRVSRTN